MKKLLFLFSFLAVFLSANTTFAQSSSSPIFRSPIDENLFLQGVYKGKTYRVQANRFSAGSGNDSCRLCDVFEVTTDSSVIGTVRDFRINSTGIFYFKNESDVTFDQLGGGNAGSFEVNAGEINLRSVDPFDPSKYSEIRLFGYDYDEEASFIQLNTDIINGDRIEYINTHNATINASELIVESVSASNSIGTAELLTNQVTILSLGVPVANPSVGNTALVVNDNKLYFWDQTCWREVELKAGCIALLPDGAE